jgi:hypothetical protein
LARAGVGNEILAASGDVVAEFTQTAFVFKVDHQFPDVKAKPYLKTHGVVAVGISDVAFDVAFSEIGSEKGGKNRPRVCSKQPKKLLPN